LSSLASPWRIAAVLDERLTVVVPHYGAADPTLHLIEQLRDQAPSAQLVVVDDASPEPLDAIDGVELVRRDRNGGFGSAVNSGAAVARGDYLMILNSDLDLEAGFVNGFLEAARPWGRAICGPAVVDTAGEQSWSGRYFPTVSQQVVEWLSFLARFRPRLRRAVGYDLRCVPGQTGHPDWLVGAALLVPTTEFRAVGGFDERFFMNVEEVDLQRRLRERGVPSVYLGSLTVRHEGGASSGGSMQRRRWLVRSRRRYARKWGGWRSEKALQVALTVATAMNLAANGARRACGRPVSPLEEARKELSLIWAADGDEHADRRGT
jgi:N-acetylglucosaminyl-diphospho-decaprenol L-rhamnosyltransferase